MAEEKVGPDTFELEWRFSPRVISQHFGSQKYTTSSHALGELVANALDARASLIRIETKRNALDGIDSILIRDNGKGMSRADLERRFIEVGVDPDASVAHAARFGRFGVGRLAVHRIGELSEWRTVADTTGGARVKSSFRLHKNTNERLCVEQEEVSAETETGTTIEIFNIRDDGRTTINTRRIADDLLAQFCSFLLGNRQCEIRVHPRRSARRGKPDRVQRGLRNPGVKKIIDLRADKAPASHKQRCHSRFPAQLLFSAIGRTVATCQPIEPPPPDYLGLVECRYLDSIVTSNREAIIEMDNGFAELKALAIDSVQAFTSRWKTTRKKHFVETARKEAYYPYSNTPVDSISRVEQAIYDVMLEMVNEHANIEGMTRKQTVCCVPSAATDHAQ